MLVTWTFINHPETYERKSLLLQPFSTTTNLMGITPVWFLTQSPSDRSWTLLCTYDTCILCIEALREAHSRFSLKTQEGDGFFQKHVRVEAPFCPLAAQRNQPLGSEVGLHRYLRFSSFLHHLLSVSTMAQLNKHRHFAGGRQADANEAAWALSRHKLLRAFLGSLNILKCGFGHLKLHWSCLLMPSCPAQSPAPETGQTSLLKWQKSAIFTHRKARKRS